MPWLDATWQTPCWFDGDTLPFDVSDRGLLLADGVFDTSLVLGGRMVWRAAHVARLIAACRLIGFKLDPVRVERAIDAVVSRTEHGSLRITATRGVGPRGLAPPADPHPTLLAASAPLRAAALFSPLRLHVSAIRRNDTSPLARIKSLNYLEGILASADALRAGCDDALLLNTRDLVTGTSVGNIFAVIGTQLVTPPLADGVIEGTVRGVLLSAGEDLGLAPVERSLTMGDLAHADAIVCTNSLRLVAPIVRIDRRPIAGSLHGAALTAEIAARVRADVGVDPQRLSDV